ncbi:hypothetical protein NEF87_001170 [Candidatus Lokiarchaeum ossiferum]|uniref:DNA primase DnaG n=1 Tax=Candidatus Lokiarchaeum ossiferum TaxID=2951803 RepID=A0ABY6HNB0_9ARCH|nr:hypothetical protein NEF87_001170 [Candidatus Lokiarchaeum sp. B-35]
MTKGINESVDQTSAKYNISATFSVHGVVEVQDVVGALFGQTEGLLNDLELRELQKSGRIGRIVVNATSANGVTTGDIIIPSSLDRTETAILAATLETVDRVGPCRASLVLTEIRDLRESKLKQIEARAKELLKDWKAGRADKENISDKINLELQKESIITWNGLPAGADINTADRVIIVEGRNDIQQLLKIGVKNTVAVNGTSVPKAIIDLTHKKECIAFLDGDRGGDMILNELLQVSKIKFYARAPNNHEVEELNPKELVKCLQQKRPIEHLLKERKAKDDKSRYERDLKDAKDKRRNSSFSRSASNRVNERTDKDRHTRDRSPRDRNSHDRNPRNSRDKFDNRRDGGRFQKGDRKNSRDHNRIPAALLNLPKEKLSPMIKSLVSSNEAIGLNETYDEILRTSNVNIFNKMDSNMNTVVIDGVVTQRFVDKVIAQGIKRIIAVNINPQLKIQSNSEVELFYFKDFL